MFPNCDKVGGVITAEFRFRYYGCFARERRSFLKRKINMSIEQAIDNEDYQRIKTAIFECREKSVQELQNLFCADFMDSDTYMEISATIHKYYNDQEDKNDKKYNR